MTFVELSVYWRCIKSFFFNVKKIINSSDEQKKHSSTKYSFQTADKCAISKIGHLSAVAIDFVAIEIFLSSINKNKNVKFV